MKFIYIWVLAVAFLSSTGAVQGAEKWALLVGVGDYVHGTRLDLKGPANDVRMFEELLLSKFGYQPENIRKLTDYDATMGNIVHNFRSWLIDQAKPEDTVLFYYSGHGSQIPDKDGDEQDGMDECLVPADVRPGSATNTISDDKLSALFDQIQANDVTIILDACHSGTGTRDIDFSATAPQMEYRFVDLGLGGPKGGARHIDFGAAPEEGGGMDLPGGGASAPGTRSLSSPKAFTLISSSAAHETSASSVFYRGLTRIWSGVLTFNLINALKKADANTTYEQVMANVNRDVKKTNRRQTPQMEGAGARPIFSNTIGDLKSYNYIRVVRIDGKHAQLKSSSYGAEAPGSIYKVLDPDTGQPVGRIKITKSLGSIIDGEIIEGLGKVRAPAMAREEFRAKSDEKLHVQVADFGDNTINLALRQRLQKMDFVWIANTDTAYFDVEVNGMVDGDVLSLFTGYEITAWLEEGGVKSSSEVTSVNVDEIMGVLRPLLENAYAIKKLTRMDNDSPPFNISVWASKTPDPGQQEDKFVEMKVGDPIYFHFRSDKDAYLTLLNVDAHGAITILFPNGYMSFNRVVANKTYTIPSPEMGFEMHLGGPAGQEFVKAFATEFPMDLSSLNSQAVGGFRALDLDFDAGADKTFGPSVVDQLTSAISGNMNENMGQGTRAIMLSAAPQEQGPPPGTSTDKWSTDYLIIDAR